MRWSVRTQGLVWKRVGGQVVVLDLASSTYFSTGESGALLWDRLCDGASEDELVLILESAYGLARQTAVDDVRGFLSDGAEAGILSSEDPPE